jgi:hypothetical protein
MPYVAVMSQWKCRACHTLPASAFLAGSWSKPVDKSVDRHYILLRSITKNSKVDLCLRQFLSLNGTNIWRCDTWYRMTMRYYMIIFADAIWYDIYNIFADAIWYHIQYICRCDLIWYYLPMRYDDAIVDAIVDAIWRCDMTMRYDIIYNIFADAIWYDIICRCDMMWRCDAIVDAIWRCDMTMR